MPVEAKPLFRPDVLRPLIAGFELPDPKEQTVELVRKWARMLSSAGADALNEKEILPDFLTDIFCGVLSVDELQGELGTVQQDGDTAKIQAVESELVRRGVELPERTAEEGKPAKKRARAGQRTRK